jgi:zinc transport system ATP-binding protein
MSFLIMSLKMHSPAPMEDVLEVDHLSIRLGGVQIFKDLSLRVRVGASVAIIGSNGSGKTALFRALVGAIPVDGTFRWAPGVRIGYVPQKLDIARDVPITGLDFLRARASLTRSSDGSISSVLGSVGLPLKTAGEPIGELSGGEFQRLLVAFALMGSPNVLLLDEPTAGVDEPGRQHLTNVVHSLQLEQHLTVMQISHDLTEVRRSATTVVCLSRDQIWIGPPKNILTPDLLHSIYGVPVEFHVHDV